jgi:integrase
LQGAVENSGVRNAPVRRRQQETAVPGFPNLTKIAYALSESYVFTYRAPATGTKARMTLGSARKLSLKDVAVLISEIERKLEQGIDPREGSITVAGAFDRLYRPHIEKNNRAWRDHVSRFDVHVRPVLGNMSLQQVSPMALQRLVDNLKPAPSSKKDKLSDATVNRVIALLKAFFSKLAAWGLIAGNVARPLKVRRERNQRRRVLRDEEFQPFFEALEAAPPKVRLLILLLIYTGIRLSEALKSRWQDVSIEVSETGQKKGSLWLPDTKSGKPRAVPLSLEAIAVLDELAPLRENDYLFPGRDGGHMSRPGRQFRALIAKAGTDGLWLHDCRRVFGTLALRNGASPHDICNIFGHSDVRVTERYLVPDEVRLHDAAELVGRHIKTCLARENVRSDALLALAEE